MRFYHGYRLRTLLHEPAPWFFALLDQAFKIQSEERLHELGISAYPHMKKEEANSLRNAYDRGTRDILEVLVDYEDGGAGVAKLKENGM